MNAQDIIDALVISGICLREQIEGCTEQEIAQLERKAGAPLPQQYKTFLAAAGRAAPGFFTGTDFYIRQVDGLTEDAADLLRENNEPFDLPAGAFVFSMHQGYVFHYFILSDDADPPVYTYCEGKGMPRPAGESFSDYLLNSVDWHVRIAEEARAYSKP
ncbi:SMI1/KNR4 family protein [Tahibacter harae]|uniref:SMI1/KNR4 family protein n=1 Tax=Tahibacter harae TaxID=2963937 RepID=A0ABT1QRC1_9GAMM|nr:SMI1/KNR4 family protein [Tahibacter harae]MCQ4164828.1 SMI1/KNR4 family protein [Tahibacter harae]